jgi:hypothetical protein
VLTASTPRTASCEQLVNEAISKRYENTSRETTATCLTGQSAMSFAAI